MDETRIIINSDFGTVSRLLIERLRKVHYYVSICLYCSSWIAAADNSIVDLQYASNMGVAFLVEGHHYVHIMCSEFNLYL